LYRRIIIGLIGLILGVAVGLALRNKGGIKEMPS
jgi:hypothetical protein